MFAYARMQNPGLGIRKSTTAPPGTWSTLCHCGCHPPQKPPPAVEARLFQECADERFTSWQAIVDVLGDSSLNQLGDKANA